MFAHSRLLNYFTIFLGQIILCVQWMNTPSNSEVTSICSFEGEILHNLVTYFNHSEAVSSTKAACAGVNSSLLLYLQVLKMSLQSALTVSCENLYLLESNTMDGKFSLKFTKTAGARATLKLE